MFPTKLLFVFLCGLLVIVVKWCYKHYRIMKILNKFPSPDDTSFLFGNMTTLFQTEDILFTLTRKYAKDLFPHYKIRILYNVSLNIFTPEDCEIFMGTKKHSRKSPVYDIMKNWLKEGLLVSNGKKWAKRRKILTPAFHFSILKDFVSVFNEGTQRTIDSISRLCSEPIDVCSLVTDFTLSSICETAMGCKLNLQDEDTKEYINAIHEAEQLFRHRMMRPWLAPSFLYYFSPTYRREVEVLKTLHGFTKGIINKRMKSFDEELHSSTQDEKYDEFYMARKKRRLAFLDVLLQARVNEESIDYDGICEEVDTFMFEGHDTTAAAISFCLMLIANNPDVQANIVDEIEKVAEGRTMDPTYEDLQKMEYLERCIKETLRLYPSVFFISRYVDEDTVLHSGLVVPEGTFVHIHIFDVLRNPSVFPSPDTFDPDRFLPENCQDRHPFAYIPFSAGPRNCIGQRYAILEIKAFICGVLSKFILTPIDTPDSIVLKANLVLRVKDGIKVKFTPRKS